MPLPVSDTATITMPVGDFRHIEEELDSLRAEIAAMAQSPTPAPPRNLDGAYISAVAAALDVVRFAVGNLPPETIVGWPLGSLATLTACLETLNPHHERATIMAFREFLAEAREIEQFRARRYAAAEVAAATAPDFDPMPDPAQDTPPAQDTVTGTVQLGTDPDGGTPPADAV